MLERETELGLIDRGLRLACGGHGTLHGLFWLTANVAELAPLLLAVDDLHWCDAPSLRFFAHLGRRLQGLPVLLLAGTRPSEPGAGSALLDELLAEPAAGVLRPR